MRHPLSNVIWGMVGGIGGLLLAQGTIAFYQGTLAAARAAEPPQNWLIVSQFEIPILVKEPTATVTFEVLRPAVIRTNIQPRNLETGEPICVGRTVSPPYEASPPRTITVPLRALAGVQNCIWPPGKYSASVTFTITDREYNVQPKPLVLETNVFEVVGE